jgi:glycosyltransferase involved in cell wall biosynthesis
LRVCIFGSEIGYVKKGVYVGGAQVSAVRLAKALHSQGDQVFVFSSAPRGKPSKSYSAEWGTVVNRQIPGRYMSFPYLLLYGLISFFGLIGFCKKNRIQVISSHAGSLALSIIPSTVGKILHLPVVHTQYCEVFESQNRFIRLLQRYVVNSRSSMPNKFCGISHNVCKSLAKLGVPASIIKMVPPIIILNQKPGKRTTQRASLGLEKKDFVALFVGNLKKNKGLDVLFDSFAEVATELSNIKIVVTTELVHENFLPRKNELQCKLAKSGLENRVIWLGVVDNIADLYKQVDVVVVPFLDLKGISDYPLVVLEAMSMNKPVIATDVGGTREVLTGDYGLLVPPGDVEAISKGLRYFASERNADEHPLPKKNFGKLFDENSVGHTYHELFLREVKAVD